MKLLWTLFLVVCIHERPNAQKLDSAARPYVFEDAFSSDTSIFNTIHKPYKFISYDIGEITLRNKELFIGDPIVLHYAKPFQIRFPRGKFKVQVAINKDDSFSSNMVAYCRIKFSEQKVFEWKRALRIGDSIKKVNDLIPYTYYNAGSSTCVILDKGAFQDLMSSPHHLWAKFFVRKEDELQNSAFITSFKSHNIIQIVGLEVQSDYVFIGYDKSGKICRLLLSTGAYVIPAEWF